MPTTAYDISRQNQQQYDTKSKSKNLKATITRTWLHKYYMFSIRVLEIVVGVLLAKNG